MSKKIKTAVLHNIMAPYRFPLFKSVSKYQEIDLEVFFMSPSAKNRRWFLEKKRLGFKYRVLPKIELNFFGRDLLTYIINYTFPFEFFKNKFDVLISAGWLDFASQIGFFLCKLTGRKFIIWSESTRNEPSWRRALTLPFVKLIVRYSDACIAIGTGSKQYLQKLGAESEKIFTAYSTVDIDLFSKGGNISSREKLAIKKRIGIKTDRVIIYVGQFIERKGIIYLLKSYENLKKEFNDVSLVLLGYGPLKEEFNKFIKSHKIKDFFFIDHVEVHEMPKMYAISDLLVLPSYEETWGLVVNEAMAVGLPIITTDKVGSSADLVKNFKNGIVVPARDVDRLYQAIKEIITDPFLIKKMSANSKKIIKRYSPQEAAANFVAAIKYTVQ